MIRPLFQKGSSRPEKGRMSIPVKIKAALTLVTLTLLICAFFDEESNKTRTLAELTDPNTLSERLLELGTMDPCLSQIDGQKTLLKCKTIPEMIHEMSEGAKNRNLYRSLFDHSKTSYARLLGLGSEEPSLHETNHVHRTLQDKCKTVPDLILELDDDRVRKLHSAPFNSKTIYERILELGADGQCLTAFPPQIEEAFASEETILEMYEPSFEVATDDDDQFVAEGAADDAVDIAPGSDSKPLDEGERDLVESFEPDIYPLGPAEDGPLETDNESSIAYTVALTGCPQWYEPTVDSNGEPTLAPDLYESSAVVKCAVCEASAAAATNRRLGLTRKLAVLGDQTSAAEMDYSMNALIHPMAIECPVEGSFGETYDRVKLMKSLDYRVDIVGHPITADHLEDANQSYLMENIEDDAGIRDSTKLHIWRMTYHPAVVLMNHGTILQQPLDQEIDTLLADDNLKGMYVLNAPDPETGSAGVDTGLLIIKPDLEEFHRIVDTYINTPFSENGGWGGQGYNDFAGHLGISGFLAYYFDTNPGYMKLDRCTYAHDADDACNEEREVVNSRASKIVKDSCGDPRDCPYDHPRWSQKKKESCSSLHRKYYEQRYTLEEKYLKKDMKQERIGFFKQRSFLGYCTGAGKKYSLSMVGRIIPKQEWQKTCPPDGCPSGMYLKPDCTCTQYGDDPCDACPGNTYCQREPTLMCIDCSCGFCDASGTACCEFNGINNCKDGPGNNNECAVHKDSFPAFVGSGNVCGGVEISRTAVPNGCGCKPNSLTPCTYNQDWGTREDKCFICTAAHMANGECQSCKDCIRSCTTNSCIDRAVSETDYVNCLRSIKDDSCRVSCHPYCMKSDFLIFGG